MVHVELKFSRRHFKQLLFDVINIFARRKVHPVADAENMGVHRNGWPAKIRSVVEDGNILCRSGRTPLDLKRTSSSANSKMCS